MSRDDEVFFAVGRAWDEQKERFALLGETATENQLIEMLIASTALLNEYSKRDARHLGDLHLAKGTRDGVCVIALVLLIVNIFLAMAVIR